MSKVRRNVSFDDDVWSRFDEYLVGKYGEGNRRASSELNDIVRDFLAAGGSVGGAGIVDLDDFVGRDVHDGMLNNYESRLDELNSIVDDLKGKLADRDEVINKLREDNDGLVGGRLDDNGIGADKYEGMKREYEDKLAGQKALAERYADEISEYKLEISEYSDKVKSLNDINKKLEAKVEEAKQKHAADDDKIRMFDEYAQRLEILEDDYSRLDEYANNIEKEYKKSLKDVEDVQYSLNLTEEAYMEQLRLVTKERNKRDHTQERLNLLQDEINECHRRLERYSYAIGQVKSMSFIDRVFNRMPDDIKMLDGNAIGVGADSTITPGGNNDNGGLVAGGGIDNSDSDKKKLDDLHGMIEDKKKEDEINKNSGGDDDVVVLSWKNMRPRRKH